MHVAGQCVTGDTLLAIVAKEFPISNFQFPINDQIKHTRIDEVKAGDYVISLNEETGELVPAKINGLMDMGVKPIYKLTTESGKNIRTTANHPYLVKQKETFSCEKDSLDASSANATDAPFVTVIHFSDSITDQNSLSKINKKSAEIAEVLEPQNDSNSSVLTSVKSITDKNSLSRSRNFFGGGPAGYRTPEPLMSKQSSNHSGPTADLLYHNTLENTKWTKVHKLRKGDEIAVASGVQVSQRWFHGGDSPVEPECEMFAERLHSSAETMEPTTGIVFEKIVSIEILPAYIWCETHGWCLGCIQSRNCRCNLYVWERELF